MTTANKLYDAIAAAHSPPEWACFREVANRTANRTGLDATRRADAVAMCLWPSRGLIVRGYATSRALAAREALGK